MDRISRLRSIAVVPLGGHDGTVGILEAFSARSYAFGAEQIGLLKRVAEIAQSAYEAERGTTEPPPEPQTERVSYSRIRPELFASSTPDSLTPTAVAPDDQQITAEFSGERRSSARRYWIAGGAVLLLLTAGVIWTTWQEPDEDGSSPQQVSQPQKVPDDAATPKNPAVLPWKPPAGLLRTRTNQSRPSQVLSNWADSNPPASEPLPQNAAETEKVQSGQDARDTGAGQVAVQETAAPQQTPDPPGAAAAPAAAGAPLTAEILADPPSTATILPALDLPVSQGVSEAKLVHRVEPRYPAEARSMRVGGSVVLEMTIEADGSPRDLKVVSGPSLLTRAATDAIQQWRYHPALLNGKPVAVQKQITVVFRAP